MLIPRTAHRTNASIFADVKVNVLLSYVCLQSILQFFRLVARKGADNLERLIVGGDIPGKRMSLQVSHKTVIIGRHRWNENVNMALSRAIKPGKYQEIVGEFPIRYKALSCNKRLKINFFLLFHLVFFAQNLSNINDKYEAIYRKTDSRKIIIITYNIFYSKTCLTPWFLIVMIAKQQK